MFRKAFSLMLACVIVISAAQAALADQITLKNGDRVSGSIVKSDGKKITVKTEFMGTVEIAWDQVDKLASDKPVYLTLNDNQTVVGLVSTTEADTYQVATKETGNVKVAKSSIAIVRNEAEYNSWKAEIERLKNPGLTDLWAGALDVGFSMARGNAATNTFTLSANAARATSRDKISVYGAAIRASQRTRNAKDFTQVANAVRGGLRYDVNISSRSFVFGYGDLEFDQFQNLDLRASLGGGLGYKAIKSENTTLDLFGGGGFTKEYFSAGTPRSRSRVEVMMGEELTHKLGARSMFRERFVIFPNLREPNGYRFAFDTSLVTSLNKWLAWQVTFSDRYLSNPPVISPALKKNDTLLTTGLRFTFAK